MGDSVRTRGALVRVTIVSDDRRLDVSLAAAVPLIEVLPGFARSLGVLDPALVHGGFALRRADGSTLDAALSAPEQGIRDGEVLTLARGTAMAEPRVYDDLTEAVIDAATENHRVWSPRDSSRTALAVSLAMLVVCALLLLSLGRGSAVAMALAAGATVLLLVASGALAKLGQVEAGHALGLASAAFAATAAYLAAPSDGIVWGWPLAAAAGGAFLAGGIAWMLNPRSREIHAAPLAWAAVIGPPALVTALVEGSTIAAWTVMVALAGAVANLLPWLAMSSTRIKALAPTSEQEIFADAEPIDAEAVKARALAGARLLDALRIAVGAAIAVATLQVASVSATGALLTGLAFLGMMFQSRQTYARGSVLVVMAAGGIGIALTAVVVAFTQPDLRTPLLVILVTATAALVALTMVSPRARIPVSRAADACELLVLTSLLPLGLITAGWA